MTLESLGIDRMSVNDRLRLIDLIWESLPEQLEQKSIPDWHLRVLQRRIDEADADPTGGIPWDVVRERLLRST